MVEQKLYMFSKFPFFQTLSLPNRSLKVVNIVISSNYILKSAISMTFQYYIYLYGYYLYGITFGTVCSFPSDPKASLLFPTTSSYKPLQNVIPVFSYAHNINTTYNKWYAPSNTIESS